MCGITPHMSLNNLLTGFVIAPLIFLMSAVSLTSLLRLTEYVALTAKSTSVRGWEREYLKPLCKNLAGVFEKILGGNKITVTPTNILLMAIVIVLFAILLTLGENNEKAKKAPKEKKN